MVCFRPLDLFVIVLYDIAKDYFMATNWQIPTVENRDDELLRSLLQKQKTSENSELNRMFGRAGKYYDRVVGEQTGFDPENLQTSRDYLGFLSPAAEALAIALEGTGGLLAAGSSLVGDTVGYINQGIYPDNSPMRMTDNDINSLRKTGAAFLTEYTPTPMGVNQLSRINPNNYQPFQGNKYNPFKDGKFNMTPGSLDNLTPNNLDNLPPGGLDNLTNAVVKQNQIDAIGPRTTSAGYSFDPSMTARNQLERIPDETFDVDADVIYDGARRYKDSTRDDINKRLSERGLTISSVNDSRASESQYWNVAPLSDPDDLIGTVRFSDHPDFFGGNDVDIRWGQKPDEITSDILEKINLDNYVPFDERVNGLPPTTIVPKPFVATTDIGLNDIVSHDKFGRGKILSVDGNKAEVLFDDGKTKMMNSSYLTTINKPKISDELIDAVSNTGSVVNNTPIAATNDLSLLNAVVKQTDEYKERLAAEGLDSRHNLDVQRMDRIVGGGKITAPEKIVLGNNAPVIKLAKDTKTRFPENDGWAKLEVAGVKSNKPTFKEIPYTFHQNTKGKAPKKNTPEREGLVNNITNNVVADVNNLRTRAEQGDTAAQRILSQASWYKIFSTRLRETFGGNADMMADVLGGSSPNTAVAQNWKEAVTAIEQFDRGEFDTAIDAWIKHREAGGTITNYQGPKILRDNGKNFGTDAKVGLMMDGFAGTFRNVKGGDAPKARNFSGNLAGTTNAATIDVWAARFLNRMAGKQRVPTVAEAGVKGKYAAGAETVGDASTGQFGFGQDVFQKAADELGMPADDLQAVVWFLEKEHWTKNNWTSVAGEGGSVEQQLDNAMMVNHQIGMTTEGAVPLSPETMKVGMDAMEDVLRQDGVVVHSNRPTIGLYGDGQEASYDIEWTTRPGYDGLDNVIERLAEVSKASEQKDAFISKVLTPAQAATNPNTRFGVEIAFKKPMTAEEIKPLVQFAEQNNVYGATLITGGNRADASSGAYRGIRFQANPEMAARFNYNGERELFASNPDAVYDWMEQQMPNLEMVRNKAGEFGNIANSRISFYDTLTIGQESYDDFIRGKNASGTVGSARFGQPLSGHVRNRLEALKRNPEGNRVGNLYRINSAGEEVINPSNLKDPSLDDPYRVRGSIRDDLLRQFELLEKNNGGG